LNPESPLTERLGESQVLLEISQRLAGSADLDTILQQIVDAATVLISRAGGAVIHVLDEREQFLQAITLAGSGRERVISPLNFRPGVGIAGLVLLRGERIYVPDVRLDPNYVPGTGNGYRICSLAVTPVMTSDRKLGTLSIHSDRPGAFTADDERLLALLGMQAALALEKAQWFDATQRRLAEVKALYKITQGMIEALDIDTLLRQVINSLTEHFGYYHVHIYLKDRATGDLVMRQGGGDIGARLKDSGHRIPAGKGIVGHVAASGNTFITNNVRDIPFFIANPRLPETWAELAVPLRSGERVLGVVDIQHKPPQIFGDQDVRLMTTVANQVAVVLEKLNMNADLQAALRQEQAARTQLVQSEKLAALGRIVASVAHELNNPLQAIQNALYLVKVSDTLDLQSREDVQIALGEANRMADIIARLRETYRPASGEDFRLDSLNLIIQDVQRLISAHLSSNHIDYRFDPDPDLPLVPMIRDQIKQVILNICLNAAEAMENGGKLIVRTRFAPKKSRVNFTVTDTGVGIPHEILPLIFDPFVTTKTAGTGLGLAITDDIIQRHHGKIEVDSTVGKGTTFTVWLPLEHL